MKYLLFDCFSGISGDMTIGALLNLGLPFAHLEEQLQALDISNYSVRSYIEAKHGISGTKFEVIVEDEKVHRHLKEILDIIDRSPLTERVKNISRSAFRRLAEAEAKVHNTSPEKIHFHEVGGVDAIVDIVGSAIGVDYFAPDRIYGTVLPMGKGIINAAHGPLPLPAPATLEILKNYPVKWTDIEGERVTPTGAAILVTLIEMFGGIEKIPDFKLQKTGYGAGSKDFADCPNLLRLILGDSIESDYKKQDVIEILETNIDDMNPQIFEHLLSELYGIGANEVFIAPVIMKKSRPGSLLTVLCKKELVEKIGDIIFRETSTAGIRFRSEERLILERRIKTIETEFGPIRVKLLQLKNDIKIQPEFDDCAEAARRYNIPLADVIGKVRRQAESLEGLEI